MDQRMKKGAAGADRAASKPAESASSPTVVSPLKTVTGPGPGLSPGPDEAGQASRDALFRHVTNIFLSRQRAGDVGELTLLLEILKRIIRHVSLDLRRDVAMRIAASPTPPMSLVHVLLKDEPAVVHILLGGGQFSKDEWRDIAGQLDDTLRAHTAERDDLPAEARTLMAPEAATSATPATRIDGKPEAETHETEAIATPVASAVAEEPAEKRVISFYQSPPPRVSPFSKIVLGRPQAGFQASRADLLFAPTESAERTATMAAPSDDVKLPARATGSWTFETDRLGRLTALHGFVAGAFGRPASALLGSNLVALVKPFDPGQEDALLDAYRSRAVLRHLRVRTRTESGVTSDWDLIAAAQFAVGTGQFTGYRGEARPLSDGAVVEKDKLFVGGWTQIDPDHCPPAMIGSSPITATTEANPMPDKAPDVSKMPASVDKTPAEAEPIPSFLSKSPIEDTTPPIIPARPEVMAELRAANADPVTQPVADGQAAQDLPDQEDGTCASPADDTPTSRFSQNLFHIAERMSLACDLLDVVGERLQEPEGRTAPQGLLRAVKQVTAVQWRTVDAVEDLGLALRLFDTGIAFEPVTVKIADVVTEALDAWATRSIERDDCFALTSETDGTRVSVDRDSVKFALLRMMDAAVKEGSLDRPYEVGILDNGTHTHVLVPFPAGREIAQSMLRPVNVLLAQLSGDEPILVDPAFALSLAAELMSRAGGELKVVEDSAFGAFLSLRLNVVG